MKSIMKLCYDGLLSIPNTFEYDCDSTVASRAAVGHGGPLFGDWSYKCLMNDLSWMPDSLVWRSMWHVHRVGREGERAGGELFSPSRTGRQKSLRRENYYSFWKLLFFFSPGRRVSFLLGYIFYSFLLVFIVVLITSHWPAGCRPIWSHHFSICRY